MIYNIYDELYIILYLVMYSLFVCATFDIIHLFTVDLRKAYKYLIEQIYWLIMIVLAFKFSFLLMKGYIPPYFYLFFILGYIIYILFCRKNFMKINRKIMGYVKNKKTKKLMMFFIIDTNFKDFLKSKFRFSKVNDIKSTKLN